MTAFHIYRFCLLGFARGTIDPRGRHCDLAMDRALAVQGQAVDIGGYYHPDEAKVEAAMRPSAVLNGVLG